MIKSAEEFLRLRTSEVQLEYQRAASDSAPIDVWLEIIRDYPEMTSWVVHNKTVPLEVLALVAQNPNPALRHDVACNRKLSAQLFELLASDKDETVRARIALNRKCPPAILARLHTDHSALVLAAVRSRGDA